MADVFISYRRKGGAELARLVRDRLQTRGVQVFLDVTGLGSGPFDERLLKEIEEARNFVLALTPGCLERCVHEDDWVRREIAHAIASERNIVPIWTEHFEFPQGGQLPPEIVGVARYNGVRYFHDYPDAALEQLLTFLVFAEHRGNIPPPLPTVFYDREDELEKVVGELRADKHVVIAALGGCGKTRLAHQSALELREQGAFPDGEWWVDLRAAGDLGPAELAAQICETVSRGAVAGNADAVRALAQLCERRRRLLWIDNVDSPTNVQSVRNIAPHVGSSRCLVTSRRMVSLPGALHIRLEALEPEAAVDMLVDLTGWPENTQPPRSELRQVCAAVGHLPLGIELIAGLLGTLAHWDVDQVLQLTGGVAAEDAIRQCFEKHYEYLDPYHRDLLMTASLLAAKTIDLDTIEATMENRAGVRSDVEAGLAHLAGLFLLRVAENGFVIHPLVKEYSRAKLRSDNEKRPVVQQGYVAHFLDLLQPFRQYLEQGREPSEQDLEQLRPFRDDYVQAAELARALGLEERAMGMVSTLIGDHLDRPHGPGARLAWWAPMRRMCGVALRCAEAAERAIEPSGPDQADRRAQLVAYQATIHKNQALFHYWLGDNDRCVDEARTAQSRYQAVGDRVGEAVAVQLQGYVYDDTCEYNKAEEYYRQGLELAQQTDHQEFIAVSYHLVGCGLYHQARNPGAEEMFSAALAVPEYRDNELSWARSSRRLATIRLRQGQFDRAEELLKQCLDVERERNALRSQARTLRHLGRLALCRAKADPEHAGCHLLAADGYLEGAISIFREIANVRGIGATQHDQAWLHRMKGEYQKGLDLAAKSLHAARSLGARYGEALCLLEMAGSELRLEEAAAAEHYQQGTAILQSLGLDHVIGWEARRIDWPDPPTADGPGAS